MREIPENMLDRLDDYVDGELSEGEAEAFEAELSSSPELQARLRSMQRLESGIRESFASAVHRDPERDVVDEQPPRTLAFPVARVLAYAAVVALIMGGVYFANSITSRAERFDAQNIYRKVAARFEPQEVCDTPAKFEAYTLDAFGTSVAADFDTPVQLLGWSYPLDSSYPDSDVIEGPRVLLARAEGEELIVIFQDPGKRAPTLDPDSALRLHKRSIGGQAAYEVSPLDEPRVIPLLRMAKS